VSLEDAYAHVRAGRLAEAEAELRRVVGGRAGQADALELLGIVLSQQGRAYEALEYFDRAIVVRPEAAGARHNRAQALFALGRVAEARAELDAVVAAQPDLHAAWSLLGSVLAAQGDLKAEQAYRRALMLRPDHPETHDDLGVFFLDAGRLEEAIACSRKAIALRANFVAAHNNLANALRASGRLEEALTHYAQAVRLEPRFADGWLNYGAALREAGRVEEAIPALERAVGLAPQAWSAISNLGVAYLARNRYEEAIACQRKALELKPDSAEVLSHLGNALAGTARWDEAEACYRQAIQKAPAHAEAHNNLGALRIERGDVAGAAASFRNALELKPGYADAAINMGFLLQEEGRIDEAIEIYRRALAADPRNARAGYNLGIALVSRFEFTEGWELCEMRYDTVQPVTPRRPFVVPRLEREPGAGERIAVWREQGVGDQILYSTLLPQLSQRARFVVEVDRRLVPAFRRAYPDWSVAGPEESEAAFSSCDAHIALGSLPRLLRPSLASFAAQPRALLAADAVRARAFREEVDRTVAAAKPQPVVGISWRSFQPRVRGELGKRKSATLAAFLGLSLDARLLDLQYGDTVAEREEFARAGGRLARLDGLDLRNDLDGLIAAIEACDIVVTTSNVTAHLAGAVGKRTLLVFLNARPPFHYWSSPHGRSLWYPSVEIVTAPELDGWERALGRVNEILFG
jgi:tetratricopeptide (TPR) repeat protein